MLLFGLVLDFVHCNNVRINFDLCLIITWVDMVYGVMVHDCFF